MKRILATVLVTGFCSVGSTTAFARSVKCEAKQLNPHPGVHGVAPVKYFRMTLENEKFEMDIVADFGGGVKGSPLALTVKKYSNSEVVLDRKGNDIINYRGTAVGLPNDLTLTLSQPALEYGAGFLVLQDTASKDSWRGPIDCKYDPPL